MKTYVFEVDIEQDDDGRWGAEIPLMPGCNAWGYTKEQALEALRDTARAFLEIMLEDGEPLPEQTVDGLGFSSTTGVAIVDKVSVTLE